MTQNVKDWLVVVGGVSFFVALGLWVALVAVPSWWTAHQECSGTNGVVVEQKDILRPVVCLRVQP